MQALNFSGLSAQGIEYWRGDRRVLAGVTFELRSGECVHVLGPNGAGKTTLLRLIAGLLIPEQGAVEWGGRATRVDRDAWHASFSYLAHSDSVKPELTAHENLAFDVGLRRPVDETETGDALVQVGLGQAAAQFAGTLSAGQRRRLALARVMLAATPLWILDEPYTNLDASGTELVSAVIGRHLEAGGAALIAAHQPPAIRNHVARRLELA